MTAAKKKHWCGCVTEDYEDGVRITVCDRHRRDGKYIWIALQHPGAIK